MGTGFLRQDAHCERALVTPRRDPSAGGLRNDEKADADPQTCRAWRYFAKAGGYEGISVRQ